MSSSFALAHQAASVLVVLAGSAGAIGVLGRVLAELPEDLEAAIAVVQHRSPVLPTLLVEILRRRTRLRVERATENAVLERGTVYLAPPDRHLLIGVDRTLHLVDGRRIRHVRSSANPLFESAAAAYGANVLGIVLSGYDKDATDGVQRVAARGGIVIVQDPRGAFAPAMPRSALATGAVRDVVPVEQIAAEIIAFVAARHAS